MTFSIFPVSWTHYHLLLKVICTLKVILKVISITVQPHPGRPGGTVVKSPPRMATSRIRILAMPLPIHPLAEAPTCLQPHFTGLLRSWNFLSIFRQRYYEQSWYFLSNLFLKHIFKYRRWSKCSDSYLNLEAWDRLIPAVTPMPSTRTASFQNCRVILK